ncbi:hypothetical protein [cf. Phormidesmis sp. LEGE 11477]|uniref:hypothetical protein n=1 Tax=cf. Phormidesmis sp. LEGE 11477 TaxID=1828680 RepID=UPI00187DF246|nr:hypothetical protein [cf. Phormidesmis sp. LEGE 11477]MBE9060442.1 hypothetical protein [cf. Phormidesmis sp. LEGE 11477]
MIEPLPNLQALTASIEAAVEQLFYAYLGTRLDWVECRVIEEMDFVIRIERPVSATENYLFQQQQDTLALEMGLAINQALKNRLFVLLCDRFGLAVADISFLQSAQLQKLDLLVLLDGASAAKSVKSAQRRKP